MFEGTSGWSRSGAACKKKKKTRFPAFGSYKVWLEKDNWVWNFMRTIKCWTDKSLQQVCRKKDVCEGYVGEEYSARREEWIGPQRVLCQEGGEKALQAEPPAKQRHQKRSELRSGVAARSRRTQKNHGNSLISFHDSLSPIFCTFFINSFFVFHKYFWRPVLHIMTPQGRQRRLRSPPPSSLYLSRWDLSQSPFGFREDWNSKCE